MKMRCKLRVLDRPAIGEARARRALPIHAIQKVEQVQQALFSLVDECEVAARRILDDAPHVQEQVLRVPVLQR